MWKALADSPKHQQITTPQCTFDNTVQWLGVRALIIATPSLIKMDLTLGFHLNPR